MILACAAPLSQFLLVWPLAIQRIVDGLTGGHPALSLDALAGGVVGLRGNLAPEGAIVKIAGMEKLQFEGTALCFDSEEEAFAAVQDRA